MQTLVDHHRQLNCARCAYKLEASGMHAGQVCGQASRSLS